MISPQALATMSEWARYAALALPPLALLAILESRRRMWRDRYHGLRDILELRISPEPMRLQDDPTTAEDDEDLARMAERNRKRAVVADGKLPDPPY